MANQVWDSAKDALLKGEINVLTDTLKITCVSSGYNFSGVHQHISDVSATYRIETTSISVLGVDGGDLQVGQVQFTGFNATVDAFIIWKDTGTESTSPLIAYIDSATGLPITPTTVEYLVVDWVSNVLLAL